MAEGWFDLSTWRAPYRVEGKKTMGIELAEAGGWGDAKVYQRTGREPGTVQSQRHSLANDSACFSPQQPASCPPR